MCAPLAAQAGQKPPAALPLQAPGAPGPTAASTQPAIAHLTPAEKPARRAEVSFSHGQLAVTADNASLNQILREIGRQTGIAISGGVAEERVFGKYGPAPSQNVLAMLLDGTDSNMMFVADEGGAPAQLILTPRQGGVTPPNPNAPGFDDDTTAADEDAPGRPRPRNSNGVSFFGEVPSAQGAGGTNGGNRVPSGTQTTDTPANTATPQTPNGIKTPQEIFQQLQQLRQQQQLQTPPQ